jgi:hypothetical protein
VSATEYLYPLKFHEQSCATCRYFRIHRTAASVSECLLHGRTLGITEGWGASMLIEWGRARLCDLWSRRPRSWNIFSEGVEQNPHFHDPYLPRSVNERRRKRLTASRLGARAALGRQEDA